MDRGLEDWQIKFSSSKCKVLHVGNNNPNPNLEYFMSGLKLNDALEEKDLGVIVDTSLCFESHMNNMVKKANRMVGMITHYISHKTSYVMVPLFKSLVRPILEYGNVVWAPRFKKHIDHIEGVQRRFTRRIIGLSDLECNDRLKSLKLPSLEYRRARGDMIETG